jgi:hypothetical protein
VDLNFIIYNFVCCPVKWSEGQMVQAFQRFAAGGPVVTDALHPGYGAFA